MCRELDQPSVTRLRRMLFRQRPVLKSIYTDWYRRLLTGIPEGAGAVLEVGSGGGFLEELLPDVVRSDLLDLDSIDVRLHATQGLPFQTGSLKAIVGLNVLHHLSRPRVFLREVVRCLRPGGVLHLIEPWNSLWSRFIYSFLHHEPFRPHTRRWEFASTGPLSGANGALAYLLFHRDRTLLQAEFPALRVERVERLMPLSYACSGGFSHREFLPPSWFEPLMRAERHASRLTAACAMFAEYRVRRL